MDTKKKTTATSQSAGGRQGPAQSGSGQEATAFRVAPDVATDLVPGKVPSRGTRGRGDRRNDRNKEEHRKYLEDLRGGLQQEYPGTNVGYVEVNRRLEPGATMIGEKQARHKTTTQTTKHLSEESPAQAADRILDDIRDDLDRKHGTSWQRQLKTPSPDPE